jgi:hypothetical protein
VPRRLLALLIAGLALLSATGCADDVSPALRVGDTKISNDELLKEIDQWVHNPVAVDAGQLEGLAPGAYPGDLVRQLLRQRIDFAIHNAEFERRHLELNDQLRQDALTALFGDPAGAEQAYAAFSKEFADEFTDDVARQIAVQDDLGDDGYVKWLTDAYAKTDIEVNPRYGTWDPTSRQVTAPPSAATSSTEPTP